MSEQTNKTTGGVWVACSERMPEQRHADARLDVIFKNSYTADQFDLFVSDFRSAFSFDYWLDTTVEIVTREEHDAEVAKLRKENEELRARIEELKELANSVCLAEDGVWCYGVNKENWFDARNRILKGCKDGD